MKKLFFAFLFTSLLFPVFSLGVETSLFNGFNGDLSSTIFTAGVSTDNPIFNISGGLYYDTHDIELEHEEEEYTRYTNYYYDYDENGNIIDSYPYESGWWNHIYKTEKKSDLLIGTYLKLDWSILPIKISNVRIGTNLSLLAAFAVSELGGFELPLGTGASVQARINKLDVLAGAQIVTYPLSSSLIDDFNFGEVTFGFPIGIRYNFGGKTTKTGVEPESRKSRTHILDGSGLSPSL